LKHIKSLTFICFYILPAALFLASCQSIPSGELNPINVSGCDPEDYHNRCITSDVTTPNERTAVCSSIPNGWAFRTNSYLISGNSSAREWRKITPRTGTPRQWENCSQYIQDGLLVEGEYALTPETITGFTTTIGDICNTEPTIVIYRFESDWLMRSATGKDIERYKNPMYEFYVGAHNARWIQGNMIDLRILAIKELTAKQCGTIPNKINVLGRFVELPKRNNRGKMIKNNYTPTLVYSGAYYPKIGRYRLIPDNQEIATELREIALIHKRANDEGLYQARLRYEKRMERSALGALLIGIGAFAIHNSSPCSDPSIPAYDKPSNCK